MKPKFEVFEGEATPEYFFRLKAGNGKIIAQSEGYSRRRDALKTIAVIKKCAAKAKVEIIESKTDSDINKELKNLE